MFAVIAEGGRQYRVQRGLELRVDYREGANPGDAVTFDQVLLAGNNWGLVTTWWTTAPSP